MAATKLVKKLISSMIKKKKKGKSYSEQVKPKNVLYKSLEEFEKIVKGKKKPKTRQEVVNSPRRKMKKSEGMLQGKKVTQEKAPTKKTKTKSISAAADKAKKTKVSKKSDKRIEGSGSQSARPKGSIGKTRSADSPRGGTTGMKMSEARKKQMRDTADLGSEMKKLGRKYDDLPKGVKRTIIMAIKSRDPKKITSAFKGTNMTRAEFVKVHNKRLGGR